MKKIITLLLAFVIVCTACTSANATAGNNLMITNLAKAEGLLMTISDQSVSYSDRFNGNGALNAIADGNKTQHADVYGAKDSSWVHPAYVGVLLTLDNEHLVDSIAITSGLKNMPDTYRIYAGTSLDDLYQNDKIIADGIVCENSTETVRVSKTVKYIAIFCTEYVGNQRIMEIEVFGTALPPDPDLPADDDYTAGLSTKGNRLFLGDVPVTLRGVNIPQFSWSAHGDGSADTALYQAINEWKCEIVRLAVDPNVYVNGGVGSGSGQTVSKTAAEYQAIIDRFVTTLTDNNIAVVLDCHAYSGAYDTVVSFWDVAAPKYDSNELVMYGLLNEPISDWTVWYEGGDVTLPVSGVHKNSIGIPALLDRIRAVSDNVAVIGGIDWAFDLSGIASDALAELAYSRATSLGMTQSQYIEKYSLCSGNRKGRGIMLDTHIYSGKPVNWDAALAAASKEYPVLVGEYNPYFRSGVLSELNAQEKAFLQKVFRWITEKGYSSTSWSLGAEPFLTDHAGNITAIGVAVKEYVQTGKWECGQAENLIYQHYSSAKAIYRNASGGKVSNGNHFINQAHSNNQKVGNDIIINIIDGETTTHYDIYPYGGINMGMQYTLDDVYACHEIRMTSGLNGYPDKYQIYASDDLSTLYSDESLVENFNREHTGTVTYTIDRAVKYIAFLGFDYVRIKEISLSGVRFGDMNADNSITAQDTVLLRKQLLGVGSEFEARGDVTRDGENDIRDLVKLKKDLAD